MARKEIKTAVRLNKNEKKELWIHYLTHDHFYPDDVISFKKAKKHIEHLSRNNPSDIDIIIDTRDDRSANNVIQWREKAPIYRQLLFRLFDILY